MIFPEGADNDTEQMQKVMGFSGFGGKCKNQLYPVVFIVRRDKKYCHFI